MFNLNNIIKSKTGVVLGALLMCFSISIFVMAWTDPSTGPPDGNIPAPMSSEGGIMTGDLYLSNSNLYSLNLVLGEGGTEGSITRADWIMGANDLRFCATAFCGDADVWLDINGNLKVGNDDSDMLKVYQYCDENGANCHDASTGWAAGGGVAQTLGISGHTITLSDGGGSVTVPDNYAADTYITTQTCPAGQYLSSVGKSSKTCSTPAGGGGGGVTQTLGISGHTITLSDGGGSVTVPDNYAADTNTNASTICNGTNKYLDGNGNCDTITGGWDSCATIESNCNYVNESGDTMTGRLNIQTGGGDALTIKQGGDLVIFTPSNNDYAKLYVDVAGELITPGKLKVGGDLNVAGKTILGNDSTDKVTVHGLIDALKSLVVAKNLYVRGDTELGYNSTNKVKAYQYCDENGNHCHDPSEPALSCHTIWKTCTNANHCNLECDFGTMTGGSCVFASTEPGFIEDNPDGNGWHCGSLNIMNTHTYVRCCHSW